MKINISIGRRLANLIGAYLFDIKCDECLGRGTIEMPVKWAMSKDEKARAQEGLIFHCGKCHDAIIDDIKDIDLDALQKKIGI